MTAASAPWGKSFCRRCAMRTRCAGTRSRPATACQTTVALTASPYRAHEPRVPRSSARRSAQRRHEAHRQKERVAARLLRPLHEERAGRQQDPTHERDPAVEHLACEHDEQGARGHRPEHGRKAKRPLRRSREARPRAGDRVVEHVVLIVVDPPFGRAVHGIRGERLVEPEGRRAEPDQSENERDAAGNHDSDDERRCAHARQGTFAVDVERRRSPGAAGRWAASLTTSSSCGPPRCVVCPDRATFPGPSASPSCVHSVDAAGSRPPADPRTRAPCRVSADASRKRHATRATASPRRLRAAPARRRRAAEQPPDELDVEHPARPERIGDRSPHGRRRAKHLRAALRVVDRDVQRRARRRSRTRVRGSGESRGAGCACRGALTRAAITNSRSGRLSRRSTMRTSSSGGVAGPRRSSRRSERPFRLPGRDRGEWLPPSRRSAGG